MRIMMILLTLLFLAQHGIAMGATTELQRDIFKTSGGDLEITFIGHGTLMFKYADRIIQIDPWTKLADYSKLPKADLILVTHAHPDHLDLDAIKATRGANTKILVSSVCAGQINGGDVMKNGETRTVFGIKIEAIPAYNLVHKRDDGQPWHPQGDGNGYLLTFGDKRVYVAGDTENTPEMKALKNIDVAFLPMNLPYTMTPEMVADAAKAFKPRILYPYHTGETDTSKLEFQKLASRKCLCMFMLAVFSTARLLGTSLSNQDFSSNNSCTCR